MKSAFRNYRALALAIPLMMIPQIAFAAFTGMPWETPVESVTNSIAGPVLKAAMTLFIIGAGIAFARSADAGVQKFTGLIFGGSIAGAVLFMLGFFKIGAGALI